MRAMSGLTRTGSAQAIGGSFAISGPAGGTETGAAIRAAARQLRDEFEETVMRGQDHVAS